MIIAVNYDVIESLDDTPNSVLAVGDSIDECKLNLLKYNYPGELKDVDITFYELINKGIFQVASKLVIEEIKS